MKYSAGLSKLAAFFVRLFGRCDFETGLYTDPQIHTPPKAGKGQLQLLRTILWLWPISNVKWCLIKEKDPAVPIDKKVEHDGTVCGFLSLGLVQCQCNPQHSLDLCLSELHQLPVVVPAATVLCPWSVARGGAAMATSSLHHLGNPPYWGNPWTTRYATQGWESDPHCQY